MLLLYDRKKGNINQIVFASMLIPVFTVLRQYNLNGGDTFQAIKKFFFEVYCI